ncbi:nitroreductase family protein [Xanthomarina sp. F2636L]|uniref:nitroreductase family protein n=1 Tax=Xanthomarina sp. F2636L TaxID=2996018 RepID=UPI00225E3914|nr:nitroreductase family protein [Xanthomarina sp. F2636L]MCX7550075.1 nitroreductase family protein [Xanthomarina sp. F2636L]
MMNLAEQIRLENIADTDYEIFALLKQRYSPRTFKKEAIKERHLKQLFEAVRWSASSNNLQPWRFIYAEKGTKAFKNIYNCLSDFNKSWTKNAPVLMFSVYKEKTKDGKENFHALHDLGLSLGSMTVQAQYLGIAVHHMAGVDWEKAQKEFNVPEGYHISTAIAIGYYGGDLEDLPEELQKQETAKRMRISQQEFAFKDEWNPK